MNAAVAPAASRTVATTDNVRPPLVTPDQLKVDFAHVEKAVAELETAASELPSVLEDDEDQEAVTAVATKLIKAAKRCEEIRNEQNRPHLDATKVINDHFTRGLIARCDGAKANLELISGEYLKKKAAREKAAREAIAAEALKKAAAAAQTVTEAVKAGDVRAATVAVGKSNSLADFAAKTSAAAAAPTSSMAKTTTSAGTASLVDNWTFDELDMNSVDLEILRPYIKQTAIEQALRDFIKSGRREIKGARIFNDNKPRFRG